MKRTITIEFEEGTPCGFDVSEGDKLADRLTFEEMLGVIAALTMPADRRCLQWIRTPEQREAWSKRFESKPEVQNVSE